MSRKSIFELINSGVDPNNLIGEVGIVDGWPHPAEGKKFELLAVRNSTCPCPESTFCRECTARRIIFLSYRLGDRSITIRHTPHCSWMGKHFCLDLEEQSDYTYKRLS